MLEILYMVCKVLGFLVLALILRQVYMFVRTLRKVWFYRKQGVTIYPHVLYPAIGNLVDFVAFD